jgi:predicted TIM-barrel fold metal-dependent hydrolase
MTDQRPEVPSILRPLNTDEYLAPPLDERQRRAVQAVRDAGPTAAKRVNRPLADYWSGRRGTAAGLRQLNDAFGAECYDVPAEAVHDGDAADAALGGAETVIDVQTHFMAPNEPLLPVAEHQLEIYRRWAPEWWSGMEGMTFYGFAEFLKCVFLKSETAVAVLTAPPPDGHGNNFLTNAEMAGTRELIDRLAGTGRLLNHTVVHPTLPGELDAMQTYCDRYQPVGWKVYTTGLMTEPGSANKWTPGTGFMLDDERWGIPFLERARELEVRNICSHKGLSGLVDNGSPADIGPCAARYPDLNFLVYHSGFEGLADAEGPYTEGTAQEGINRLITTARESGVGRGGNIYAEIGTTWFCLIKRPVECAHVIGKLLAEFGADNIVWGTDSIWYGPTQPVIDAFRAFRIPDEMCAEFGYPQITRQDKEKILGLNAARIYGIDLDAAKAASQTDDLAWAKAALEEYEAANV